MLTDELDHLRLEVAAHKAAATALAPLAVVTLVDLTASHGHPQTPAFFADVAVGMLLEPIGVTPESVANEAEFLGRIVTHYRDALAADPTPVVPAPRSAR